MNSKMLRKQKPLTLNYFRAKAEISSAAVGWAKPESKIESEKIVRIFGSGGAENSSIS